LVRPAGLEPATSWFAVVNRMMYRVRPKAMKIRPLSDLRGVSCPASTFIDLHLTSSSQGVTSQSTSQPNSLRRPRSEPSSERIRRAERPVNFLFKPAAATSPFPNTGRPIGRPSLPGVEKDGQTAQTTMRARSRYPKNARGFSNSPCTGHVLHEPTFGEGSPTTALNQFQSRASREEGERGGLLDADLMRADTVLRTTVTRHSGIAGMRSRRRTCRGRR